MARILVVEDEPDIALGLQLDLRDEGYDVEVVGDGETASRRGRGPKLEGLCRQKSPYASRAYDLSKLTPK